MVCSEEVAAVQGLLKEAEAISNFRIGLWVAAEAVSKDRQDHHKVEAVSNHK